MKTLYKILILIVIISISGCFKNSDDYYKKNYHSKPLVVPSDLDKDQIDNYYPIPDAKSFKSSKVSLIPPGSKVTK